MNGKAQNKTVFFIFIFNNRHHLNTLAAWPAHTEGLTGKGTPRHHKVISVKHYRQKRHREPSAGREEHMTEWHTYTTTMRKVSFYIIKYDLSEGKRRPFGRQKDTFCNQLSISILHKRKHMTS